MRPTQTRPQLGVPVEELDDGIDGDGGVVAVDVGVVVGFEPGCQHDAFFAVGAPHGHHHQQVPRRGGLAVVGVIGEGVGVIAPQDLPGLGIDGVVNGQ